MSSQLSCRIPEELRAQIDKIKTTEYTLTDIVSEALEQFFSKKSDRAEIQRLMSENERLNTVHAQEVQKLKDELRLKSEKLDSQEVQIALMERNSAQSAALMEEREKRIQEKDAHIASFENQVGFLQQTVVAAGRDQKKQLVAELKINQL